MSFAKMAVAATMLAAPVMAQPEQKIVRQMTVDLGSQKIRATVADVQRGEGNLWKIVRKVWQEEAPLKLADALITSKEGTLNAEIQNKGIEILKQMKAVGVDQCGATEVRCVATEVFRKALNGKEFVERIRREVGVPVELVTQDQEAVFGFNTSCAVTDLQLDRVIVVDHGSGSLQVSAKEKEEILSYNSELGTIPLTRALVEKIQGNSYRPGQAPGPLSAKEMAAFVEHVQRELGKVPEWLVQKLSDSQSQSVGLGGPAGTFSMTSKLVGKKSFTRDELEKSIHRLLNLSEVEMKEACKGFYEVTLIPRILFVYSLMTHLKLETISWVEANGSTEGMLVTPSLWETPIRSKL
jgi:exopolyphosphatase/guanosine-5'-triphosphate,3'-diphosphate pyrophosphatase